MSFYLDTAAMITIKMNGHRNEGSLPLRWITFTS